MKRSIALTDDERAWATRPDGMRLSPEMERRISEQWDKLFGAQTLKESSLEARVVGEGK